MTTQFNTKKKLESKNLLVFGFGVLSKTSNLYEPKKFKQDSKKTLKKPFLIKWIIMLPQKFTNF